MEVWLWFATSLAKEQSWAVEWATSTTYIDFATQENGTGTFALNPPKDAAARQQCGQQMVRNAGGFQSFSVLGIALILSVGGVIIVMGLTIDVVVVKNRLERSEYRRGQWDAEETLALHKAVYTANGLESESEELFLPITALPNYRRTKGKHDTEDLGTAEEKGTFIVVQDEVRAE
jgi:hypothetical protein